MTWEEKMAALNALGDTTLRMWGKRTWACRTEHLEIGGTGMLCGVSGHGLNPQEAVEDLWRRCTEVEAPKYLVINAYRENRRQVRWNGFMWQDIPMDAEMKARLRSVNS